MNEATNGSAGCATRSAGLPVCRSVPSTITPTRPASAAASSKSWVTSSVGISSPASSCCSSVRTSIFVCASSAESGSSSSRIAGSRASARASATRCRSPPERLPGRACSRCAIPKRSRYSSAGVAARVLDVLADGQVREERVVLEDEADPAALRRHEDAPLGVEPGLLVAADRAGGRLDEAGDRVEDGALAGSRRPDERDRRVDREAQVELESPKRDGDLFEGDRCHESAILSVSSRTALIRTSTPLIARAASKLRLRRTRSRSRATASG